MSSWGAAAAGAASLINSDKKSGASQPASRSGYGGSPGIGPTSTAVSPTIQTQVSPQISPIFQQTGSGSQTASTSMVAPGGQSGKGGDARPSASPFALPPLGAPAGQSYMPRSRSPSPYSDTTYNDPFMPGFDIARYTLPGSTSGQMIEARKSTDWLKWGVIGAGILVAGVVGMSALNPPKKKAP